MLRPTLRALEIRGEVDSLARFRDSAAAGLAGLEAFLAGTGPSAALDRPGVLDALPCYYVPECREHCPLARRCKREAHARGDLVLLGRGAREQFAAAGSLGRLRELLRAGEPRTPGERDLVSRAPGAWWRSIQTRSSCAR
jgi:hypothetical protein